MRKLLSVLLAAAFMLSAVGLLAACGGGGGNEQADAVADKVAAAQNMTDEELIALAKEESGKFIAYGNSSRIVDAMNGFVTKYGTQIGLSSSNATASKLDDSSIYQTITTEATAVDKSSAASMVLVQDSATLSQYREQTTLLTNYIPKGMDEVMDENDMVPLAHQYINKLFIWNNTGSNVPSFTNVWELTESKYAEKIYFKSPTSEQVNMNFLIMLTSDEWSGKLETAYKAWNDNAAATDVGEGKTYPTYGHKWITEFLNNCNFTINSDTTIAQSLSDPDNAGNMGLFVLSKLRDSSVIADNLQVAAWANKTDETYTKIEPFAGFMYALYAQLVTNGPRPYTAMLFVNYLMTEEGFSPWASMGGYSANSSIAVTEGDSTLSFWRDTLVFEDGAYIKSIKPEMVDYINKILG
ncbi:MAG TPA: hypothetical protein H9726_06965 [Candidatus Borkfalkia avicola]|uniref:ABC transporter substrate-binding protein n=1 Tax=Candidatus Borkfalkia avicola TaxID=2838503 RepID=A0A9D2IJ29_9FIRM|nr:hypothetical protein [Candidatus Borkfalkia avicola]